MFQSFNKKNLKEIFIMNWSRCFIVILILSDQTLCSSWSNQAVASMPAKVVNLVQGYTWIYGAIRSKKTEQLS